MNKCFIKIILVYDVILEGDDYWLENTWVFKHKSME